MRKVATTTLLRQLPEPASGVRRSWLLRREEALAAIRSGDLAQAAYSVRIVPLDEPPAGFLVVDGERLHAPRLLPASGQLTALGFVVCTIGPRIEERVRALFAEGRPAAALALDELGNELVFSLSRCAQDRLLADATKRGLTVAGELRAGDPGLGLEAQGAVLRLGAADTIGVALASGGSLRPSKSSTAVVGVGIDLPETNWSRCDDCRSAPRCAIARRRQAVPA